MPKYLNFNTPSYNLLKLFKEQENAGIVCSEYSGSEPYDVLSAKAIYNAACVGGVLGSVLAVNGRTGNVVLTKADVGLLNVDNTSDANKPISDAVQAALALKQNLGGGSSPYVEVDNFAALPAVATHTGEIYVVRNPQGVYFINRKPSGLYLSDGATWDLLADLPSDYFADYVQSATTVNGQALTGNIVITKSDVGLGSADNTSDANKPVSTAGQTALNLKVTANAGITGATKTKITYDAKGLVTVGADATTADIADSSNKRYLTDAQLVVVGNTSGTNTGDLSLVSQAEAEAGVGTTARRWTAQRVAQAIAALAGGGGSVSSVFGRAGAVVATLGDYLANLITFTPAGNIVATDVQAAIEELDAEKTTAAAALSASAGIKLDDFAAPDDNTDRNATTTAHGLLLKATAPAAGLVNVVGIANGETDYTNKALFDTTNPAALGTVGPGTAVIAARRDHIHARQTAIVNSEIDSAAAIALSKLATDPLARANHTGTQAQSTITGVKVEIGIACSDETTAITAAPGKVKFRMPYAMTLTAVRASVTTAPTGTDITIDIHDGATTIMTTDKIKILVSEKTSTTHPTQPALTDTALADDAEISIDFDVVGSTIAGAGVKVWLIGTRT